MPSIKALVALLPLLLACSFTCQPALVAARYRAIVVVGLSNDPMFTDKVAAEQAAFRQQLQSRSIPVVERFVYTKALNAISIAVDSQHLEALSALPMVQHVWMMSTANVANVDPATALDAQQPTTTATRTPHDAAASVPATETAPVEDHAPASVHSLTGVDRLHQQRNLTGAGVRVGIIDTGIDYLHPALGGCFGPNCRVERGWDFVGDNYNGAGSPLQPDADPRDTCGGHGTHIAGIIGARDPQVLGVAPDVRFGAYRISGCNGALEGDVMLAGMERAFRDGMDIINLSIYTANTWDDNPRAIAAERLSMRGMLIVASMGNAGKKGLWQTSAPAIAPRALSIASTDNTALLAIGNVTVPYTVWTASGHAPVVPKLDERKLSVSNVGSSCSAPLPELRDRVLVVPHAECLAELVERAAKEGAVAAILSADAALSSLPSSSLPILLVSKEEIENLRTGHTLRVSGRARISAFSSWGPSPDLDIKPDLAAPGGLIYSTYPLPMGGYTVMSGTSMSTPYVVGAIALCLQARGRTGMTVTSYRQSFQNAGQPVHSTLDKIPDYPSGPASLPARPAGLPWLASVAQQGAGILNVERAIFGTTNVAPARLALNDSATNANASHRFTIFNDAAEPRRYRITHQPAVTVRADGQSVVEVQAYTASMQADRIEVLVEGHGQANITVRIKPDSAAAPNWFYSGFVTFQPVLDSPEAVALDTVHVPYLGITGTFSQQHPLHHTGQLQPCLRTSPDATCQSRDTAAPVIWSLSSQDSLEIRYCLLIPTGRIKVQVWRDNELLGDAPDIPRDAVGHSDEQQVSLYWTGGVVRKNGRVSAVSPGQYKLRLMALRPFGNVAADDDYDSWMSPSIQITA